MSQTMIDEIRRTEERAEEMKARAAAEAREMVRAAEEEMLSWRDEQMKRARLEARGTVEAAEAASAARAESEREAGRAAREALRRRAADRVGEAVRFVVERIVG